jgi:hypothetical protein
MEFGDHTALIMNDVDAVMILGVNLIRAWNFQAHNFILVCQD